MKKILLTLLLCLCIGNTIYSQTEICYDTPISLLAGLDAPTQNEFESWIDLSVKNSTGGLVYQSLGGQWYNSPVCAWTHPSNYIGLTNAQMTNKNLQLSLNDLLKNSGISTVDGTVYQITVHAGSNAHCWHRYATYTYKFRKMTAGAIGYDNSFVCYNSGYTVTGLTAGTNAPNGTFSYQWVYSDNTPIVGETNTNLTLNNITSTKSVMRRMDSPGCGSVYTNTVNVYSYNLIDPGSVAGDQNLCYNTAPSTLSGTYPSGGNGSYTFQWQQSTDNLNWSNVSGATNSFFNPPALTSAIYYRRAVTSGSCGTATSNSVKMNVYNIFTEGAISSDQTICYNSAPTILFVTLPSGGTGIYSYQWQQSSDNVIWNDINGANSNTYSPPALTSTTYFRRTVTSGTCGTIHSNSVKITVYTSLSSGTVINDQTICYNSSPTQLVGSSPSGGSGSYTYQWQSSTDGMNWNDIIGYTNNFYQPGNLTSTLYYRRAVSSGSCGTAYSNNVTINVLSQLSAGTVSSDQSICYNTTPATLNSSGASGGTNSYTYQWQQSSDNLNWNNITGATNSFYSSPALTNTTYYRLAVTSGSCGTAYSNSIRISVNGILTEGTISTDQTICYNSSPSILTGTTPSGGIGSYTYQWQSSSDNVGWLDVLGATSNTFTPGPLTNNTYYRRTVTSGSCGTVNSNSIKITVYSPLSSGSIVNDQTICYNSSPAQLVGSSPSGATGSYTYQWQISADGSNWFDIVGAINNFYQPGSLTTKTYYRRAVTSGSCGTTYSNIVTINVLSAITSGIIYSDQTICNSTSPSILTSSSPSGGTGSYSYQWQQSSDNSSWGNISPATNNSYNPAILTNTTYYRLVTTSGSCGSVFSNSIKVTVLNVTSEGNISPDQTICNGTAPSKITVTNPTGGNGSYTYQWETSNDSYDWSVVSGENLSYLNAPVLTATTYYRRIATSCNSATSNVIKINVLPIFQSGDITDDQSICYNSSPDQLAGTNAQGGTGTYSYQWQKSSDAANWNNIIGATGNYYQPSTLTAKTYYRRAATSGSCGTIFSNYVTIDVPGLLTSGSISNDQTICYNSNPAVINGTIPNGGTGVYNYQWQISSDNTNWNDITGANNISFSPGTLTSTEFYRRVVTSGTCGILNSNSVKITVNGILTAGLISSNQTICNNTAPTIISCTVPSGGTGIYTYQWQVSSDSIFWSDITGANAIGYIAPNLLNNTYYRLAATSGSCGTVYSSGAKITVLPLVNVGSISDNQTICNGFVPAQLNGTNPTGGTGTYSYQWQKSADNSNWTDISGTNNINYHPSALIINTYFRRGVVSGSCSPSYTNSILISVSPAIIAGSIGSDQTICYGTSPAGLIGTISSGGVGNFSYQWQSSNDGSSWNNINGTNTLNFTPSALNQTTYFRRVTTSGACGTANSNAVLVNVYGQLKDGNINPDQEICFGTTPSVISVTSPSGGDGNYSYQWQASTDNFTWTDISTATGYTFAPGSLTSTVYFRRKVTTGCGFTYSDATKVNVFGKLLPGSIGDNQTICYRTKPDAFINYAYPNGGTGSYTYQWQKSSDSNLWTNVPGGTQEAYGSDTLKVSQYFRRIETSGSCGSVTSNIVLIAVNQPLASGVVSSDQNVCYNSSPLPLTSTAPSGGTGVYTYQWQKSSDGIYWNNINMAKNSTYNSPSLISSTYYRLATSAGTCGTVFSNNVVMNVYNPLQEGTISADQSICNGSTPAALSVTSPSGGNGSYTYQWQKSSDNLTWVDLPGANSDNYSSGALTSTVYFRRKVLSTCGTVNSSSAKILVYDVLTAGSIGEDQTICYRTKPESINSYAFTTGGTGSYTYQWQESTNNLSWINIPAGIQESYNADTLKTSKYYRRIETSGSCGSVISNSVLIKVNPQLTGGMIGNNQNICFNSIPQTINNTLMPNGGTGTYSYQWQASNNNSLWNDIPGETSLNYSPETQNNTVYFRRRTTSEQCGSSNSNVVTVKVYPKLNGGIIAGNQVVCYNSIPYILRDSITANGGSGIYAYQWQVSDNRNDWTNINSAIGSDYLPGYLKQSKYFRRSVTNASCGTAFSNTLLVNVLNTIDGGEIADDQNICYSSKPAPFYGSSASGGDGVFTYQWQYSLDSLNFKNIILNSNELNYTSDSLKKTTYFRRAATGTCGSNYSNVIRIKVFPDITPGTIFADQVICNNTFPNKITGYPAVGGTGNYSYNWQQSLDGLTWGSIIYKGDSINYSPSLLTNTTYFRRKVHSVGCGDFFSNKVTVIVNSPVNDPKVLLNKAYCLNRKVKLTETSTSSDNYKWFDETKNVVGQGKTYTTAPLIQDRTLFVQTVRNDGCTSDLAELAVKLDNIKADFTADNYEVEMGNAVKFNNQSINAVSYQWNFYDGDNSFEENPWHYYNKDGIKDVQLISTSENGCSDTLKIGNYVKVLSNLIMGVSQAKGKEILFYPNPVVDMLNVDYSSKAIQQIVIMDINSKVVIEKNITAQDHYEIDLSHFVSGVYSIKVKVNNEWKTYKIVKQ